MHPPLALGGRPPPGSRGTASGSWRAPRGRAKAAPSAARASPVGPSICDCLSIATLGYSGGWGQGDVFNDWLAGRTSSGGVVALASQTLTAQALAPFQVLVVQDVRSGSGSEGIGNGRQGTIENRKATRALGVLRSCAGLPGD